MAEVVQNKIIDPLTFETIYHRAVIMEKVYKLATEINEEYKGKELELIALMDGSFMFVADLVRTLEMPVSVQFVKVKSYSGAEKALGTSSYVTFFDKPLKDKDVLIVDDIVDTGDTIAAMRRSMWAHKPKRIKTACLIQRRKVTVSLSDFVGFKLNTDEFVVGYGMDYNGMYRNLPMIKVLPKSLYEK